MIGPTLLAFALLTAAGAGLTAASASWQRVLRMLPVGDRVVVGTAAAFVAGAASYMGLATLLAVVGVPLTGVVLVVAAVAGGLPGLVALRRRPTDAAVVTSVRPRLSRRAVAGLAVAAIAAAVVVTIWVRTTAYQPNSIFDSVAIWGTKSRALVHGHTLDHPVFTSSTYTYLHRDYPIGIPFLEALVAHAGQPLSRGATALLALLPVASSIVLYGALRTRGHTTLAVCAPIAFAGIPLLGWNSGLALADAVVASFLLVHATAMWWWLDEGGRGWAGLAAISGVGLVHAKAEGTAMLLAVAVAAAVTLWLRRRDGQWWRNLVLITVVPLVLLAPWALWVRAHHIPTSFIGGGSWRTLPTRGGEAWLVARAAFRYVHGTKRYALLWPCAAAIAVIRIAGRGREQPFFLVAAGLALGSFLAIDSLDPAYLISVSLDRNLLIVSALLAVWVAAGASAVFRRIDPA